MQTDGQATLVHPVEAAREDLARAHAGEASGRLDEREARPVSPRLKVVVAAVDRRMHRRRAAAAREPKAVVAEAEHRPLHGYAEPVRQAADLGPQGRRELRENPLLVAHVEPRQTGDRLAAQKRASARRRRKRVRLRAADVVRRASALDDADTKRLDDGLPV
jgi:hypothetical protein